MGAGHQVDRAEIRPILAAAKIPERSFHESAKPMFELGHVAADRILVIGSRFWSEMDVTGVGPVRSRMIDFVSHTMKEWGA